MRKLILLIALALSPLFLSAQNIEDTKPDIRHHSVYVELLGSSVFYSLNYDYTRSLSEKTVLAVGAGTAIVPVTPAYMPEQETSKRGLMPFFTPQINLLHGKSYHYFETGVFFNLTMGFAPGVRLGYRYQKPEGGFLFRAGLMPMVIGVPAVLPGFSFGYTF